MILEAQFSDAARSSWPLVGHYSITWVRPQEQRLGDRESKRFSY